MDHWIDETLHSGFRIRLKADRVLFDSQTVHQHLIVFENPTFGRMLMLDGVIQLAERDEFIYHEMMAHVPLMAHGRARRVLIVGGGDGGVLREVLKHEAVEQATLCEIDQAVIDLALTHFPAVSDGAFDDPRAEVVIGDGTRFVAETEQRFDVILVDSTDPIGPGAALFTREFYADCRRALADGGVLVTQNGLPFVQGPELAQSIGHFRELFADAWAYLATTPTYVGGPMSFGWASDDPGLRQLGLPDLTARAAAAGITTRYYAPDVHAAAFALPGYVRELLAPGAEPGSVG
ncbi:MAG: polyamine aminopropyltransferase [Methyloligellaceae bacterium]